MKEKILWFGLMVLSTFLGYLMPNPANVYISNIYDL